MLGMTRLLVSGMAGEQAQAVMTDPHTGTCIVSPPPPPPYA